MGLLTDMISHHYRSEHRNQERYMRNKLHPSTIGMCQRRIVFDMLMVPKSEPSDQLLRIFMNGHGMHDRYQKLFADMGILLAEEMKVKRGDIGGSVDAKVKFYTFDKPEGEQELIELKSASEYSFKWMKEKNTPKAEHKAQLTFYMHLSGIHKGRLFVENKDNQDVWEYPMEYDEEYGNVLEKKALWCIDLAKGRKLPPIPKGFTPSNYKCNICDYNFYCHYGSRTNDGKERHPIPFNFGTQVYFDVLDIIDAMQNGKEIPDTIAGNTNGDLAREVARKNSVMTPTSPQEIVEQYMADHFTNTEL